MTLRCILAVLTVALLSACGESPYHQEPVDLSRPTALRGWTDPAMLAQVRAALAAGQRNFTIDSHGGLVDPALEIGKRIEQVGGTLEVIGACKSACITTLMAVKDRRARPGAEIALHRAAAVDGRPVVTLQFADKAVPFDASAYGAALYIALGVPRDLVERDTAGWNVRPLSRDDLVRMNIRP